MPTNLFLKLIAIIPLFICTSCKNYSVSLNQNEIYNPVKVFTDFKLIDTALQQCVDRIIKENKLTKPEQLQSVICGPTGIVTLEGLAFFDSITHLGVRDNKVANIEAISHLKQLKQLDISNNLIKDISPIFTLETLEYVNLEGLEAIPCRQVAALEKARPALRIAKPSQCGIH